MATKQFLIAVTTKLLSKAPGLGPKCKESRDDVVVMQRFKTKTPIIPGCSVNKDKSVFEAAN
jgi:hypothetical protein